MIGQDRAIQYLADRIDQDDIQEGMAKFLDEKVFPQLDDVRQRAQEGEDSQTVRQELANLPREEQEQIFHSAVGDIITTLFQLRVEPFGGLREAKGMLRNPWVSEALLLIYENRTVDPSDAGEMKVYTADVMKQFGVALAPEMYDRETVIEVAEKYGISEEMLEHYDEMYEEGEIEEIEQE